ncbi:MAG TPA: transporter [Terriglobales bacterium]|nr:transporter [Terriglobales bacterium]
MNKWLLFTCFALAALQVPDQACAQFTDPRAYDNTPIGINQLELSYAYARANASIDTSLIITGATFSLNQGTIDYTRYFGLLHRLTWVEGAVPIAGLSGSIAGTNIQGSTTGAGDSSYQVAMLLKGGPALSVTQFEEYKPTTTFGVSLTITAPTGSYHPNKILNLGSSRWSFKPEIALSHPFGPEQKWEFDAYANAYFYTDNISYHGRQILGQQPLAGLEGHISYSFNDSIWASLDTRYSFRGTTFLNGVTQNNAQENFVLGSELNLSLNSRNSLVIEFAKALVHHNGPAIVGFTVKYDYTWGKDYR